VLPVAAFRPDAFAQAVNTFGVTSCSLAPTMLHGLLAHLEDTGEAICAVGVARSGAHPSADALATYVRAHIAAFKRPRHVLFVDALPLTSNGKVLKEAVRHYARSELS
jgi:acyl-CoA synthetase (AMP-forming)/AMP-acid ligase II